MDPRHIQLVQESLKRIAPSDDAVADIFASELLRIAPDVAGQDADLSRERRRCALGVMAMAVQSLHTPERILDEVRGLANGTGLETIQPADYDYAGNAFLRTLKKMLGPEFTSDLWEAWVDALCTLSEILSKTARPVPGARASSAA